MDKQEVFSAVLRRFPQSELAIRRLINRSEAFRDMCEELAEAEAALSRVDGATTVLREARKAEWQDLVDRLVGEVGAALEDRDVVVNSRKGTP